MMRRNAKSRSMPGCIAVCVVSTGLTLMSACSPGAQPLPPNSLTVAPVATQVSAIQSGSATPSGTAEAVATRVAPTLQAAQQTAGPIATSVAQSPVHIMAMNVTPSDTTVVLQNSAGSQVDLQDWILLFGANIPVTLPSIALAPGQTRTLHLAGGTSTDSDVYLNIPSVGAISTTFAPGQRAVLVTPEQQIASIFANSP